MRRCNPSDLGKPDCRRHRERGRHRPDIPLQFKVWRNGSDVQVTGEKQIRTDRREGGHRRPGAADELMPSFVLR